MPGAAVASSCVWKVTGPAGSIMYLGGSVHALRSSDYPLAPAYKTAFDASSHLVFEDDPQTSSRGESSATGRYLRKERHAEKSRGPSHLSIHSTIFRSPECTGNDILEVSAVAHQHHSFLAFNRELGAGR